MRKLSWLPMLVLAACGVPEGKALKDMEDKDWDKLCKDMAMEEKTVTCDVEGTQIDVTVGGTEEDCKSENSGEVPDDCEATVGDLRACNEAIYADPCILMSSTTPAECEALYSCVKG